MSYMPRNVRRCMAFEQTDIKMESNMYTKIETYKAG